MKTILIVLLVFILFACILTNEHLMILILLLFVFLFGRSLSNTNK